MTPRSRQFGIQRFEGREESNAEDVVAVEEPLEIRIGYRGLGGRDEKNISITMRTPGNDDELAAGFLFSEGILTSPDQVMKIWHRSPSAPGNDDLRNVMRVDLVDDAEVDLERLQRHFYTTSSCGVCGKASLEALSVQSQHTAAIAESGFSIASEDILQLTNRLESEQVVFGATGGLHASGLFDASGEIQLVREDVGRHNALDKLLGRLFLDGELPAADRGILVSGRASFELAQKIAVAGSPILVAVGAPSSLAVDVAREFGITLIGFLREGRYNVYSGADRITYASAPSSTG